MWLQLIIAVVLCRSRVHLVSNELGFDTTASTFAPHAAAPRILCECTEDDVAAVRRARSPRQKRKKGEKDES